MGCIKPYCHCPQYKKPNGTYYYKGECDKCPAGTDGIGGDILKFVIIVVVIVGIILIIRSIIK